MIKLGFFLVFIVLIAMVIVLAPYIWGYGG